MKQTLQGLGVLAILVLVAIPAKRTGAQQSGEPIKICSPGAWINKGNELYVCSKDGMSWAKWSTKSATKGSTAAPDSLFDDKGDCIDPMARANPEDSPCWYIPEESTTPFDVPPVVKESWNPSPPKSVAKSSSKDFEFGNDDITGDAGAGCPLEPGETTNSPLPLCINGVRYLHTIIRTCKNKSRFLLMSEDGVWHCLLLGGER